MEKAYKCISAGSTQKCPPGFFVLKSRWHQFKVGDKRGKETQTSQIKLTSSPLHKLVGSGVCLEI